MKFRLLFWFAFLLIVIPAGDAAAQHIFMTARTGGFGSPSLLIGFSYTRLDADQGEDYTLITARASIGIGRKTDIFGSFDGVLADDVFDTNFSAFTVGLHHSFIKTGIIDIGSFARLRGNRTDEDRFEDALLDFAGMISIESIPFHPYYAIVFSRPFGFDLTDDFQRTSVFGVEVPLGDVPRVFAEVSLGDRRSFGAAFKLAF